MASIIDADAHLIEGMGFVAQAIERWPDKVELRGDGPSNFGLYVEGRRYPQTEGPGCGVPVRHGVCETGGIDPSTPEGMLAAADREGIDLMVMFPHWDSAYPEATRSMRERVDMSESLCAKVLGGNAARFFDLA